MLGQILSTISGQVGNYFGGGIMSTIGRSAGQWLGNYLTKIKLKPNEHYGVKNLHDSFHLNVARYGDVIPLIFGSSKVQGKIIWAARIRETKKEIVTDKKSKTIHNINHLTQYVYHISCAICICEGEIAEVSRVWAGDELINLGDFNFRLYNGSEDQMPDPIIKSDMGEHATSFRGTAYIFFEDLPLAHFGDTMPVFSFEVIRKANVKDRRISVEDIVESMIMIPGSGEFVYDPVIQYKTIHNLSGLVIDKKPINSHNHYNIANSVHSLNQLKLTCENVKWIAPVACWFADSLDIARCKIKPAIEFNDPHTEYSEDWCVGKYDRKNAHLISRDSGGNPTYGGSINDASLIRYLQLLRAQGLKIMFYPMFLLDTERKPWRGHLTGAASAVSNFFNKPEGYNNFILHYANLVKDHVDAFVIGTELIGLTQIRSGNNFPAVDEFVKLAERVKTIVGNVLVTYAADWSEYHHTKGGWYNLDKLWANPAIDFIGIDAYFPVTRTVNSNISKEEIVKGWQSGEGFDYYIEGDTKKPLAPEYAWKNLAFWWSNKHVNPDGQNTAWQPYMKKIWFTEFGFPSIDKSTNQPNVFFDPLCSDGGVPQDSSGETNFSIQRHAIRAFIEYWQAQEYIGQIFLWTWDARPYPAWPHMNIWRDGNLWEKGHWVNNKFGAASLAAIISEISVKNGLSLDNIDVSTLDEAVEGMILHNHFSGLDIINILRLSYFFDMVNHQSAIKFIRRGCAAPYPINSDMIIENDHNNLLIEEIANFEVINTIALSFLDHSDEYNVTNLQVTNENPSNKPAQNIQLPLVYSAQQAQSLAYLILKNAALENKIIKFNIAFTALAHEPADFVILKWMEHHYQLRIIEVEWFDFELKITGIVDDHNSYYLAKMSVCENRQSENFVSTELNIIDLASNSNSSSQKFLSFYINGSNRQMLYMSTKDSNNFRQVAYLKPANNNGKLILFNNSFGANIFLIDELSTILINYPEFASVAASGWNKVLCGAEIIKFKDWRCINNETYELKNLIRGFGGTEKYMNNHISGETFIMLDICPNLIPIDNDVLNKSLFFKINDLQYYPFILNPSRGLAPYIKLCTKFNDLLVLIWVGRGEDYSQKQYIIKVQNQEYSHEIVTTDTYLNLKYVELNLSGSVEITIVMMCGADLSSEATFSIII